MKNNIYLAVLAFSTFSPLISYAEDNSARKDTCAFTSTIINKGGAAAANILVDMFSWNEKIKGKVKTSFGLLENYQYAKGTAYIVADFDNLFERHFLVISTKEGGNLYAYLNFENYENQLRLTNVTFNDSYNELIIKQGPFSQEPKKIGC